MWGFLAGGGRTWRAGCPPHPHPSLNWCWLWEGVGCLPSLRPAWVARPLFRAATPPALAAAREPASLALCPLASLLQPRGRVARPLTFWQWQGRGGRLGSTLMAGRHGGMATRRLALALMAWQRHPPPAAQPRGQEATRELQRGQGPGAVGKIPLAPQANPCTFPFYPAAQSTRRGSPRGAARSPAGVWAEGG